MPPKWRFSTRSATRISWLGLNQRTGLSLISICATPHALTATSTAANATSALLRATENRPSRTSPVASFDCPAFASSSSTARPSLASAAGLSRET